MAVCRRAAIRVLRAEARARASARTCRSVHTRFCTVCGCARYGSVWTLLHGVCVHYSHSPSRCKVIYGMNFLLEEQQEQLAAVRAAILEHTREGHADTFASCAAVWECCGTIKQGLEHGNPQKMRPEP
eukprot:366134-Chlamydomonas_euryale.AAC.3